MKKTELSTEARWSWGQWVVGLDCIVVRRNETGINFVVALRILPFTFFVEWDSVKWEAE